MRRVVIFALVFSSVHELNGMQELDTGATARPTLLERAMLGAQMVVAFSTFLKNTEIGLMLGGKTMDFLVFVGAQQMLGSVGLQMKNLCNFIFIKLGIKKPTRSIENVVSDFDEQQRMMQDSLQQLGESVGRVEHRQQLLQSYIETLIRKQQCAKLRQDCFEESQAYMQNMLSSIRQLVCLCAMRSVFSGRGCRIDTLHAAGHSLPYRHWGPLQFSIEPAG